MLAKQQYPAEQQASNLSQDTLKSYMTLWSEYYSKDFSKMLLVTYFKKLRHLSDADFTVAAERCIDELHFFPKIPEILARLPNRQEPPQLNHKGALHYCRNTYELVRKFGKKMLNPANVVGEK